VHGPNGFYRSFTGHASSPHILVSTEYERSGQQLTGNVKLHLRINGDKPLTARIQDNSYKTGTVTKTVRPEREEVALLTLKDSHGWYDFIVNVDGSEAKARFAGRVETGRMSFTDPLMGGVV
jgi:phospholipase C